MSRSSAKSEPFPPSAVPAQTVEPVFERPGLWIAAVLIFVLAALVRVFFWQATPDASWPYSVYYRGDAVAWLEYADALQQGYPYEMGLPMRPPGAGYLIALLWNGTASGIVMLRMLWCLLGALVVALFFVAVRRSFGSTPALLAGCAAACSTGLMILSSSLNNEIPYLVPVMGSFCFWESLRQRPSVLALACWSILHALACLVRVEHVIFYVLVLVFLGAIWRQNAAGPGVWPAWRRSLGSVCLSLLFFVVVLIPWQIHAQSRIARFNEQLRPSDDAIPTSVLQVEKMISHLPWDEDARQEQQQLPGFTRRLASDFVAATVLHRGGTRVRKEDFRILEEAFGYKPEPLSTAFIITSYGPLNFYLANNRHATGGFNRFALDEPPPLVGGASRYYHDLLLTPPQSGTFFLDYPPHLEAYNHGYAKGWRWIRTHPGDFLRLVLRKLANFWSGASLGFTGFGVPLGVSGEQKAVDILVPEGGGSATVWRLAVLLVFLAGIPAGFRRVAAYPWLLFLISKVVVVVLFYGYARLGATIIPVVFLVGAIAVDHWILSRVPLSWRMGERKRKVALVVAGALCVVLVLVEGARCVSRPTVTIDAQQVGAVDPVPGDVHRDRLVEVR